MRNGESQEKVAKSIGISRGALSYYESGERKPDINVLHAIAKHYNVSTDYLLGLSDTKQIDIEENAIFKQLGLSFGAVQHLKALKQRIDTEPIYKNNSDETTDEADNERRIYDELLLHTINSLVVDDYELTSAISIYLFTHFSHFSDFYEGEYNLPISHLELYDSRLRISFSEDYDLFSNALLLEIQKKLMALRDEYSKTLTERTVSETDDYPSDEDVYNAIHNFVTHDLKDHRKW